MMMNIYMLPALRCIHTLLLIVLRLWAPSHHLAMEGRLRRLLRHTTWPPPLAMQIALSVSLHLSRPHLF